MAGTGPTFEPTDIIIEVDTHKDIHVAVALDGLGRRLDEHSVGSGDAGSAQLLPWAQQLGTSRVWAIEGTGSYGAGLARRLRSCAEDVREVSRPDRRTRRTRGKSDSIDAEAAARAALAGHAIGVPRAGEGASESLRQLRATRRSAIKARTQAANLLHALLTTAPGDLRAELDRGTLRQKVSRCAGLRPSAVISTRSATKQSLRSAARRWQHLNEEITDLNRTIATITATITATTAPTLLEQFGVGPDVAAALLITAGGNSDRLAHEAGFAALCGVSPLQASSGKTRRHRLNRGGDRQANAALHTIALVRMRSDPKTRAYVERRTREGLSRSEIMRCLKRYIARQLHPLLLDQAA